MTAMHIIWIFFLFNIRKQKPSSFSSIKNKLQTKWDEKTKILHDWKQIWKHSVIWFKMSFRLFLFQRLICRLNYSSISFDFTLLLLYMYLPICCVFLHLYQFCHCWWIMYWWILQRAWWHSSAYEILHDKHLFDIVYNLRWLKHTILQILILYLLWLRYVLWIIELEKTPDIILKSGGERGFFFINENLQATQQARLYTAWAGKTFTDGNPWKSESKYDWLLNPSVMQIYIWVVHASLGCQKEKDPVFHAEWEIESLSFLSAPKRRGKINLSSHSGICRDCKEENTHLLKILFLFFGMFIV